MPATAKTQAPEINSMKFGEIRINGKIYYSDMAVWWDGRLDFITKRHILGSGHITKLLKRKPEAIVIGTGHKVGSVVVTVEARKKAKDNKVKLFIDESPDAIAIFNGLIADGKRAVALIHVTC